ncbi:MAG TPA: cytochrome c [Burkholderiaceae bacterium]|jgi:cytochrome c5|nr:cytochrome c [Burkholderiaceae bacterium]
MRALDAAIATVLLAASCGGALADEDVRLKEGVGRDVVQGNCSVCHSADYIQMNSPFMKRAAWEASVNKMIKVMGAPIRPEDVPIIVEYLTKNYGVE